MAPTIDLAHVWNMASDASACRELQQALDDCNDFERLAITEQLKCHVWACIKCRNANHVLQKIITVLRPKHSQFIIDEIMEVPTGAVFASKHPYGCRIIERLIEHCQSNQLQTLIAELLEYIQLLSKHPFGNFVVQHIIEFGTPKQKHFVANTILNDLYIMQHPFHFNVVEKCLALGLVEDRHRIYCELKKITRNLYPHHPLLAKNILTHVAETKLQSHRTNLGFTIRNAFTLYTNIAPCIQYCWSMSNKKLLLIKKKQYRNNIHKKKQADCNKMSHTHVSHIALAQ